MQCCPICLSPVLLEEEAFLQPCWHRFHFHCIQRWSEIQHRHSTTEIAVNSRSGGLKCPMCRQPYEAIMFDCIDKAFRFAWVDPQRAASQPPPVGYTMQLTPQQRRRRSVYFRSNRQQQQQQQQQAQQAQQQAQQQQQPPHQQPQPHQQQQHHQQQQVYSEGQRRRMSYMDGHAREHAGVAPAPAAAAAAAAAGAGGSQHKISGDIRQRTPTAARAASRTPRKQPRRLDDPVTRQWLERELQALVLEEDVSLLLAAAWGSLLAACREQRQQQQQQQYKPYKAQATPCPGQPEHQTHMAKAAGPLPAHTAASQGPWPGLAMTAAATKSVPQQTKSAPSAHTPSGKAARPILRGPALAMPCRPQTANRPASAARQGAPALPPRSTPVPPETYDLDAASNGAPALSPCSAPVPPEIHAPVPPESSAIQPCRALVQQHSPCSAPVPPEMHASNTELPGSCCLRSGSQRLQVAETQATWFTSMEPPVQTHETQATDAESLQSHQLTSSQGATQSHEGEGSHSSWQRRLSEAVQPFLEPAHAQQLPQELEAFLASGLSMQAYDQQMFQPQLEQQYEQEQEQEQGSTARVSDSREAGEHEAGGVKRRRGNDLSGHRPEVIEVFDDEEDGCHRPSTPISISSSSDSD